MNKGLMSSSNQHWETPRWLLPKVERLYHVRLTLDVASTPENAVCPDRLNDGMLEQWDAPNVDDKRGVAWCNPPYGRQIGQWTRRAIEQRDEGNWSVLLLPARTDTTWFRELYEARTTIYFICGRLKFGLNGVPLGTAPFPSCLVFCGHIPHVGLVEFERR